MLSDESSDPAESDALQFANEIIQREIRIPGPIDNDRRTDDVVLGNKTPKPTIKTVIPVVTHAEDVVSFDHV